MLFNVPNPLLMMFFLKNDATTDFFRVFCLPPHVAGFVMGRETRNADLIFFKIFSWN